MTWETFDRRSARRKGYRRVSQEKILEAMREVGDAPLDHVAGHFGISEATARRKLDGLVAQGLLRVTTGSYVAPRHYYFVPSSSRPSSVSL